MNTNPALIVNATVSISNDTESGSLLSLSGSLKEDIAKIKISLHFKTKNEGETEYTNLLFRTDMESCAAQKGGFATVYMMMIEGILKDYSNMKDFCPLKKGSYYLKNFGISGDLPWPKFLPSIPKELNWEATVIIKARATNKKSLAHGFTLKIRGSCKYS